MTARAPEKRLATLLRTLRARHGAPEAEPWLPIAPDDPDRLLRQLLFSFMLWESAPTPAAAALERLGAAVVDANELRVCLPDEIAEAAGDTSERGRERAARLRSVLNEIYRREHRVTLDPTLAMPKRDARAYLASLEGMPPFVAARLTLLALGGHAFPLDERLRRALVAEGALPADLGVDEAGGWLERQLHAGEAAGAYIAVEASYDARFAASGGGVLRLVERSRKPRSTARRSEP